MENFWENDIRKLEKGSSGQKNIDIVFLGSSSFTIWTTIKEAFNQFKVLNHGFGGSGLSDAIYFYDRLVTPFKPRMLVVYSGSNDITGNPNENNAAEKTFESVKQLYENTNKKLPGTIFCYISINLTKLRFAAKDEITKANTMIREYSENFNDFIFIDSVETFLKDGYPDYNLFQPDNLHLSDNGYEKWLEVIKPVITEALGTD